MKTEKEYIETNKKSWDNKVENHLNSDLYDMESLLKGQKSLNNIELELLGDVKGKRILHLQCHFGQDTILLARMGAIVTGVDFSKEAIQIAKELTEEMNVSNIDFIYSSIYDLPEVLNADFDIVYTSYGVIPWLPDMDRWAQVVSHFLKKGGRFVFAEFHPVIWIFDDEFKTVKHNYFNKGPIVEIEHDTYTDEDAVIKHECAFWNHSLSDVLNSLMKNGLRIRKFNEYDYSPYDCFLNSVITGEKQYRISHMDDKLPLVFALEAMKE